MVKYSSFCSIHDMVNVQLTPISVAWNPELKCISSPKVLSFSLQTSLVLCEYLPSHSILYPQILLGKGLSSARQSQILFLEIMHFWWLIVKDEVAMEIPFFSRVGEVSNSSQSTLLSQHLLCQIYQIGVCRVELWLFLLFLKPWVGWKVLSASWVLLLSQ